ncbi:ABC transporter permease subunit [Williamsoniiplasma luminosum]|uniref:ABC transmembrane type-1 domain-containing protein n=1 Tax=Williamsoniiplasma luminosum TaxID=214888 RepID=A0A2S0NIZ6_9MOLU|nr:ABC transporter permease subunit [Williamsoniiplasma luminosum]AVP48988.1 MAG: hypothetical protein C5T88_00065 [Williamsoniiplasma luminosum]
MNLKQITQLEEYRDGRLKLEHNESNKRVTKKKLRKIYKENLSNFKDEIRFNFQGLTLIDLTILSIQMKFTNMINFVKNNTEHNLVSNEFIKNKWIERKKIKKAFNHNVQKNKKIEFKSQYKKDLANKIKHFKDNNWKVLKKENILISRNDVFHKNMLSEMSKSKIIEFKKLYSLKKNELKDNKEISSIDKKIILADIRSNYDYNYVLKLLILESKKEYLSYKTNALGEFNSQLNILQSEEVENNKKNIEKWALFKKWIQNKTVLLKEFITFKTKHKLFKEKQSKINHEFFNQIHEINLTNPYYKKKYDIKNLKQKLRQDNHKLKLEYTSKVIEINDSVPIIIKKYTKFVATIFGLLIPGVGQIINRQYIKGMFMLCLTTICVFLVLYAFGFGNMQGQGILGLITLGHADNLWEIKDARYFVIEGALGIIFLVIVAVYCFVSARETWHTAVAQEHGARVKKWAETKQYMNGIGYPIVTSIPTFMMLIFVVFIPILTTVMLGFTNYKPNNALNFDWVGFETLKGLFTTQWWDTMKYVLSWTIIWTLVTWLTSFGIALILAVTLHNDRLKGKILFRLIYILPWAIPGFISILLFKLMFQPGNILSQIFGIHNFQSDTFLAKVSIIMIQMWMGYCVNLVLITGILQSIPKDLYEAAEIDGGASRAKLLKITLPLIVYQMTPILIGQFMGSFNNFGIIYMYLDGGPHFTNVVTEGGAGATDTIASLIYKLIGGGHVARASALNIIVSGVIVAVSITSLMRSKSVKGGVA